MAEGGGAGGGSGDSHTDAFQQFLDSLVSGGK
jgi:hypothetical protein